MANLIHQIISFYVIIIMPLIILNSLYKLNDILLMLYLIDHDGSYRIYCLSNSHILINDSLFPTR
jgi:hypothetical protein